MLDTVKANHLIYDTNQLLVEVLGGIRINNLSNLRATLKLTNKANAYPLRHSVDLYNHLAVEKLVRIAAERIEIGTSILRSTIHELTDELERYRLAEIESSENTSIEVKQLNEKEREEALVFLSAPNLLQRTGEMIGKSGVIGEEINRLLMYLIFTSRKTNYPLHCISLGSSGSGKTHLQSMVSELIPAEDKIEITVLSENAFYYFQRTELRNKLILIEDLDGAEGVLYPLRELQSKRKITKTIAHKDSRGGTKTIHLTVEGPVSVSGCTTRESVYEDNSNRCFLLQLDESKNQDDRIMEHQRLLSAGRIDDVEIGNIKTLLANTQRLLQTVKVINPYAAQLELPHEVFKPRRSNAHYLQFIEAITFYHQYQRQQQVNEETGEVYIETTLEDIEQANRLMKEVLLRKSDNLNGACRNYYEWMKRYTKHHKLKTFTSKEMSFACRRSITTIKRYHKSLTDYGYLEVVSQPKVKGYFYSIRSYSDYEQLKDSIDTLLDDTLQQLKDQPNGPRSAQCTSGPAKSKKTNGLRQRPSKRSKKGIPQEKK